MSSTTSSDGAYGVQQSATPSAEPSTGDLVSQLTQQMSRLVRDEMQLAQLETKARAKDIGKGAGLFGGAGVVALYGVGALVAAAIMGLAVVLPGWAAGLIVAVVLFALAGVLALTGKKEVKQGTPPVPREAINNVRTDVQLVKEHAKR
jgi:hypothetical protein